MTELEAMCSLQRLPPYGGADALFQSTQSNSIGSGASAPLDVKVQNEQ